MVNSKIRLSKRAASFCLGNTLSRSLSFLGILLTLHSSLKKKKPSNKSGEPFHICNVQNLITWG